MFTLFKREKTLGNGHMLEILSREDLKKKKKRGRKKERKKSFQFYETLPKEMMQMHKALLPIPELLHSQSLACAQVASKQNPWEARTYVSNDFLETFTRNNSSIP